jgi:hypothetical protein
MQGKRESGLHLEKKKTDVKRPQRIRRFGALATLLRAESTHRAAQIALIQVIKSLRRR